MVRLIKKYKNRRLYDTETSQYITVDDLQRYVLEGLPFRVEDSISEKDITNATLLQIIVEMESGTTQFLSAEMLRQLITLAHHPLNQSFKEVLGKMFAGMENSLAGNQYQKAGEAWNQQMEEFMNKWQGFLKR